MIITSAVIFDIFSTLLVVQLEAINQKSWTLDIWQSSKFVVIAQKMKFFIKNFFGKCDQIRRKLRIWSHLLKKSLIETSFFVHCPLHCCIMTFLNWYRACSRCPLVSSAPFHWKKRKRGRSLLKMHWKRETKFHRPCVIYAG